MRIIKDSQLAAWMRFLKVSKEGNLCPGTYMFSFTIVLLIHLYRLPLARVTATASHPKPHI